MADNGILVVVSGFSGAGKGTVIKKLLEKYHQYALSVSATTRQPREGEVHGTHYFFISKEEFESMIEQDQLIEHAKYVDNYYGTPKQYVFQQMADGKDVILEIEIQGALAVKEKFPEALMVFITPPSAEELKRRLVGRGTETEEQIAKRLHRAGEEAQWVRSYEYLLVNDKLEDCVENLHELVQMQHQRVSVNLDFVSQLQQELKNFK